MLNCVVVDDETLARDILEGYLSRLDFVGSVRAFGQAKEAFSYLETHDADLLLLDIEMPHLNGLDLLKSLSNPPITIFTTAYRNYAFEGFELGVIDFLLKPIAYPRFLQAVEKVRDFLALKDVQTQVDLPSSQTSHDAIFVKSGVQRIRLALDDVLYIQGLKDYSIIHTLTGKVVIKGSVKAMHDLFPAGQFIRVHKSFIVAVAKISRIERNRLRIGDHQIPIGRNYKDDLDKALTINPLPKRPD